MKYINRPIMIHINKAPYDIHINRPIMIYFLMNSFNVVYYGVYYGVYNFKLYFFINVYKI